ncbi:MAG: BatD family protein [Rhodothermia bacterium]|nr:MAG: BatD family protein [Rhodothermia bacterium]
MRKLFSIILLFLFPSVLLAQEITVVAQVDLTTIGTEEAVTYTIEVGGAPANDIQTPSPPDARGLALLQSTPSTQSNLSILNGVMEQSYSFRWVYQPLREGSAQLGSTSVTVGGAVYKTEKIDITVVPQSQRPARAPRRSIRRLDPFSSLFRSPFDSAEPVEEAPPDPTDLFIRATPSDRSVVQNEQVTIEYQLFFREGVQLRQSRLTDSWDAEGFWREELDVETRPIPQIVIENGKRYNKIVLKRAAVFPTRTGTLMVDSLRIETEAVFPSRTSDPFQLFSLRSSYRPVELSSPAVTIESTALPPDAPDSFTGAVGSYRLETRIDRTILDVGGSIQFVVTISGTGNLATLEAPDFLPPAAFELYDPQIETHLDRSGARLAGSKSFTYVMVPRANGTFELPGVEFSYFDPSANEYLSERSNPVEVIVTGTAATPLAASATTHGLPVDDVAPPINDAGRWVRLSQKSLHESRWVYAALLLPMLLLGLTSIYQRHQNRLVADVGYARNRRANPLAKKHLRQAKLLLKSGTKVEYFGEVERAVLGFLGNRLNIAERGLTRAQLLGQLAGAGINEALRRRVQSLLELCDRGRFVPGTFETHDLEHAFEEAASLIVEADLALGKSS